MKWQFPHLKPQPSHERYGDPDYLSSESVQRSGSSSQHKFAPDTVPNLNLGVRTPSSHSQSGPSQRSGRAKGTGPYLSQKLSKDKKAFTELVREITQRHFIVKVWQKGAFFLDANPNNNTDEENLIFDRCAAEAYAAAILQYLDDHPERSSHVGRFQLNMEKRPDLEKCKEEVSRIFIISYRLLWPPWLQVVPAILESVSQALDIVRRQIDTYNGFSALASQDQTAQIQTKVTEALKGGQLDHPCNKVILHEMFFSDNNLFRGTISHHFKNGYPLEVLALVATLVSGVPLYLI